LPAQPDTFAAARGHLPPDALMPRARRGCKPIVMINEIAEMNG